MGLKQVEWTLVLFAGVLAIAPAAARGQARESPSPAAEARTVAGAPDSFLTTDPCRPGCGDAGCRPWLGAEFLWWSGKGDRLPPLITTSPPGTPIEQAGVLGTPGATILFGDDRVNEEWRPGVRISGGLWLNDGRTCGLEASLFFLDPTGDGAGFRSNGDTILSRPFINAQTGQPDAELVAFPGVAAGGVSASADSTVWGGTANMVRNLCCGCNYRVDFLAGYRFLRLTDTLTVNEDVLVTEAEGSIPQGTEFFIEDRFRTTAAFHGGEIGLRGEYVLGRAFVSCRASIAFGAVRQEVEIGGTTNVFEPGAPPVVHSGGLLALQSNSGRFDRDDFAVLPAVALGAGFHVTERLRVFAQYDFLFLSRVTRLGDVADPLVNPDLVPPPLPTAGPARPALLDNHSEYWLQGASLGVEFRF